ncbi:hypothetical protein GCM10007160_25430 [Litchfieldella qijiaojingensis]|uniref:Regulatory protein GemA n=1 Tax=Litchfieldella qijiaojingensis TaxID=980347 RepID=A0ABQ2YVG8_9GAMM|nr:regulatory protein GemA [Halomonas qijiaojingensis]GGX96719.1 hypothetical protein GCM10007160_25430 [Halomonas qijiaojingensis]
MLYPTKLKLLHVAKKQLGFDDGDWRDLLEEVAGCRSSRELDLAGFESVMRCLNQLGFKSTCAAGPYGRREGMATPEQIRLIQRLWSDYSLTDEPRALDHWLEHSFGISSLRFANAGTAGKAITALKRMVARRQQA